jgi:transposase
MGRRSQGQGQLFYEFRLAEVVPDDHLVRTIRALLDLSWVYAELTPYYSEIGRPSIDPVLMIQFIRLFAGRHGRIDGHDDARHLRC